MTDEDMAIHRASLHHGDDIANVSPEWSANFCDQRLRSGQEVWKGSIGEIKGGCTHVRFRTVDGLDEWTVRAGRDDTIVSPSIIEDEVESWFGERCRNRPNVFLPIDSQFDKLTWNENGTWSGKRDPAAETNIPDACVEALFSPAFIQQCKLSVGSEQVVLQGAARASHSPVSSSACHVSCVTTHDTGPRVEYTQGEGEDTCVFLGAASALHDYGFTGDAARLANEFALKSMPEPDRVRHLFQTITDKFKGFEAIPLKGTYDPLTDTSPHPTVFVPRGSDNGITYAVCKLGGWLYDSSRGHALPFEAEADKMQSLNLAVRSLESDTTTYNGVMQIAKRFSGVRIVPSQKLLTALGKRKSRE